MLRVVVGCEHLDLMVGSVVGSGPPYVVHVHGLDESKEIVLAAVTLVVPDDIDQETLRAVLLVSTSCLVERVEREKRKLALKGSSSRRRCRTDQLPRTGTPIPLHPFCRGDEECRPDFGDEEDHPRHVEPRASSPLRVGGRVGGGRDQPA